MELTPENEAGKWGEALLLCGVSLLRNPAGISAGNTYQDCAVFPPVDYVSATAITAPFQLIVSDVAIHYPLNEKHNSHSQSPPQEPGRQRNPEDEQMQAWKTVVCSELKLHRKGQVILNRHEVAHSH